MTKIVPGSLSDQSYRVRLGPYLPQNRLEGEFN